MILYLKHKKLLHVFLNKNKIITIPTINKENSHSGTLLNHETPGAITLEIPKHQNDRNSPFLNIFFKYQNRRNHSE